MMAAASTSCVAFSDVIGGAGDEDVIGGAGDEDFDNEGAGLGVLELEAEAEKILEGVAGEGMEILNSNLEVAGGEGGDGDKISDDREGGGGDEISDDWEAGVGKSKEGDEGGEVVDEDRVDGPGQDVDPVVELAENEDWEVEAEIFGERQRVSRFKLDVERGGSLDIGTFSENKSWGWRSRFTKRWMGKIGERRDSGLPCIDQ